MDEKTYTSRLTDIETWAEDQLKNYAPRYSTDPKPGCGEPGYRYNEVAWLAFEANVRATLAFLEECLGADCYQDDPRPEPRTKQQADTIAHFDRKLNNGFQGNG